MSAHFRSEGVPTAPDDGPRTRCMLAPCTIAARPTSAPPRSRPARAPEPPRRKRGQRPGALRLVPRRPPLRPARLRPPDPDRDEGPRRNNQAWPNPNTAWPYSRPEKGGL